MLLKLSLDIYMDLYNYMHIYVRLFYVLSTVATDKWSPSDCLNPQAFLLTFFMFSPPSASWWRKGEWMSSWVSTWLQTTNNTSQLTMVTVNILNVCLTLNLSTALWTLKHNCQIRQGTSTWHSGQASFFHQPDLTVIKLSERLHTEELLISNRQFTVGFLAHYMD